MLLYFSVTLEDIAIELNQAREMTLVKTHQQAQVVWGQFQKKNCK